MALLNQGTHTDQIEVDLQEKITEHLRVTSPYTS